MFRTDHFEATFSGVFNQWEIVTDRFSFIVRNLHVPDTEHLKTKCHVIRCSNCRFDLRDEWLIVKSYDKLETLSLW